MKVLWIFMLCWEIEAYRPSQNYRISFPRSKKQIGDECSNGDTEGECKLVQDCLVAREQLARNEYLNLKGCGFTGAEQIICCPKSAAEEACKKIHLRLPQASLHIIGGTNATKGEFPHMAVLGYQRKGRNITWECGATMISQQFLLTAAHCFKYLTPTVARLGVNQLDDPNYQDFGVEKVYVHKRYNHETKHNDIALIKLKKKIDITQKTTPACLYTKMDEPNRMIVSGWGTASLDSPEINNNLKKTELQLHSRDECNTTYYDRSLKSKTIVETQICARNGSSDACQGDSGGPLQIQNDEDEENEKYFVVGVTSYGISCTGKYAAVYTRVASYIDWIEGIVWPKNDV